MRKIIITVLLLGCLFSQAQVIEDGVLKSWEGVSGDILIPSEVHTIGDGTSTPFKNNKNITSISGENVKEIKFQSFYGCTALTSFNFPLLEIVGTSGFYGCTALENITTNKIQSIGVSGFHNCNKLTSLEAPNLEVIGNNAFRLESNANALLKTANLPLVTSVGTNAFRDRRGLETVYMPEVISIGQAAFWNTALASLDLPKVETLTQYAFYAVKTLTDVKMPRIKTIGLGAFHVANPEESALHTIDLSAAVDLSTITIDDKQGFFTFPNKEGLTIYINSEAKRALFHENPIYTLTVGAPPLTKTENHKIISVQVYPNPTSDVVSITTSKVNINSVLQVLDLTGKVILKESMSSNNITIDVSRLPKGAYLLQVDNAKEKLLIK